MTVLAPEYEPLFILTKNDTLSSSVYRKVDEHGAYYVAKFHRFYRYKGKLQMTTQSYYVDDLLALSNLARRAHKAVTETGL